LDDVPCFRCGYNVRGLAVDGQCPECAAPVDETLRRHAELLAGELQPLASSDPRWVRRLALSCLMILIGSIGMVAAHVMSLMNFGLADVMRTVAFLVPMVVLITGVWFSGAREPVHGVRRRWPSTGIVLRVCIVSWVLCIAAMILLAFTLGPSRYTLFEYASVAMNVVSAAICWSFFARFAIFARRLDRPKLSRASKWLAWLTAAACLATLIPGLDYIEYEPDSYQMMSPIPVLANVMLVPTLPISLARMPRLDVSVVAWAVVGLASVGAFVVLAALWPALRRAAKQAWTAEENAHRSVAAVTSATFGGRTPASSRP
jgi:hypothetical protein